MARGLCRCGTFIVEGKVFCYRCALLEIKKLQKDLEAGGCNDYSLKLNINYKTLPEFLKYYKKFKEKSPEQALKSIVLPAEEHYDFIRTFFKEGNVYKTVYKFTKKGAFPINPYETYFHEGFPVIPSSTIDHGYMLIMENGLTTTAPSEFLVKYS